MWKFQGRVYSRNLVRCSILSARKGTFLKKGYQTFYLHPPFNLLSALYRNKALCIFCKRGRCSIVKCMQYKFQTMGTRICPAGGTLGISKRCHIQVCRISRSERFFLWNFQFQGFSLKNSEDLRSQNNTKNRWLCSFSYTLFMLSK